MESPDNFTPTFVRYMTSVSIDQFDVDAYNDVASADDKTTFDCLTEMAEHVLHTTCCVDTVTFGAFLKSLDCSIAAVVIHDAITELVERSRRTDAKQRILHLPVATGRPYQPIQLVHKGQDLAMCVSRQSI